MQNAFKFECYNTVMGIIDEEYNNDDDKNIRDVTLIGKTIRSIDDDSTALVIPHKFAKELDIENSKVSMSLIKDLDGNKHLLVSKAYMEIVLR
ncbi:MAG: hypothetical protein L0H55_14215 [Candidatus Nitrosocosmicus sp.]|nr:hypothetical protein [Candidatus Nitrosocosmicus sp.]